MVKLNFIIINCKKAGTNSLFNILTNHPDIFIKGEKLISLINQKNKLLIILPFLIMKIHLKLIKNV